MLLLVELVRSLLCHRRGDGRKGDFRRFLSRNVAQFGTKYRWCLRMSHKIGLRLNLKTNRISTAWLVPLTPSTRVQNSDDATRISQMALSDSKTGNENFRFQFGVFYESCHHQGRKNKGSTFSVIFPKITSRNGKERIQ